MIARICATGKRVSGAAIDKRGTSCSSSGRVLLGLLAVFVSVGARADNAAAAANTPAAASPAKAPATVVVPAAKSALAPASAAASPAVAAAQLPAAAAGVSAAKPGLGAASLAASPVPGAPAAVDADPNHLVQATLPAVLQPSLPDETLFPHYPQLQPAVDFWTHVFADWSENQSVLHSTDDLRKIFVVLDFRDQAGTLDPFALSALRFREETQAREDFTKLLKEVDALQQNPKAMSSEQRRIFDMYADSSDPARFLNAVDTLRFQRGLRERTQHALAISGRYMDQMEGIFASYDLPKLLTRLPLMESSFNLDAYSKAGAAGVWQFIPSSARIYMRLNEVVDERRDPWTSTDAAARHLKDDYDAMRDWPLALTAYNYGRGGLARALTAVDGTTLLDLIQRYDNRRFGFASRNYYAEFLAAADVERNWHQHFGDMTRDAPVPFELVETRDYLRYDTLRRLCGTDAETFRKLNPSFRDEVMDGKLYVPPAQPIRVPAGAAERFRLAYASLGPEERFDRQRQFYIMHALERGESIGKLAHRYHVSVKAILAVNDLDAKARVRIGQTLKIPNADTPPSMLAAETHAAEEPAHAIKVSAHVEATSSSHHHADKMYRVASGQTLGGIAQRYQTTVKRLRQLNGIRGDSVRAGTMLKIP